MRKFLATSCIIFVLTFVLPPLVLATNYGEGNYGAGDYGAGETPAPTPTSTTTPTVTNTTSVASASTCSDSVSSVAADLFEIRTSKNSATLFFAPPNPPYDSFYIDYTHVQGQWIYSTRIFQNVSPGVISVKIGYLSSNTTYYFRVRPGNGCTAGSWSNVMKAKTTLSASNATYYKNIIVAIVQTVKSLVKFVTQPAIPSVAPPPTYVTPLPVPTEAPQLQQNAVSAPKKFCILWWCF